ncbi:MAG: proton-conducting transporter membrane subunit, partial [Gammaproteobacteria bacterium]
MLNELLDSYFRLDRLTLIMLMLVLLIGICVIGYSYRYMKGDNFNRIFFIRIGLLMFALMIMISSNNLILLFIAWYSAHALIVRLMIHKPSWQAAKAAGLLIRKYYLASAACIATAFGLFYLSARQLNIQYLIHSHNNSILVLPALMLLVVGVMISSTIWPFHGWLASSLNSPTPVSAIMHAGLVNGGGFLLARFAPLYFLHPRLLTTLFLWGLFSAMLGTIWKLMQTDIKRMLAYSTMGQMGYMLAQCGLGLFSAAIAHLVLHSMFKAYLFLNSANAVKQKNYNPVYSFQLSSLLVALCCGALGSVSFAYANGNMVLAYNTTLVLIIIAFVSSTQLVLTILSTVTLKRVIS